MRISATLLLTLQGVAVVSALTPLCVPPASGEDDVFIQCAVESGSFSTQNVSLVDGAVVRVVEYNIDRNGAGGDGSREAGMQPILSLLADPTVVPEWDVLIMSEVAR